MTPPRHRSPLEGLRIAAGLLTRVPVGRLAPDRLGDLGAAAPWFPLIGLALGGLAAGLRVAAGTVLGPAPATLLALLGPLLVTGALHEDGLGDCADALGAPVSRERRLEILRDPRLGTFGVLAVAFALLFAFATLVPLSEARFARAVLVAHCLARVAPLVQSRLLPPARSDGSGVLLRPSDLGLALAGAFGLAAALAIGFPGPGAVALGVALLLTLGGALVVRRGLGGSTGDTFGAAAKLAELGCYGVFAAFWAGGG